MTMNLLGLSFLVNSVLHTMNMVKAIEGSCESASVLTNCDLRENFEPTTCRVGLKHHPIQWSFKRCVDVFFLKLF